jgi:hypothetical protein
MRLFVVSGVAAEKRQLLGEKETECVRARICRYDM